MFYKKDREGVTSACIMILITMYSHALCQNL